MKKIKFLVMILSVMFIWIVGQPLEAQAAKYIWSEETNIETGVKEKSWYIQNLDNTTTALDCAPQMLTEEDYIYITAQPDEECADYLKNLSGEINYLYIFGENTDVIVGKQNGGLETQVFVDEAKATIYGDLISIGASGKADVTVYGDVGSCELGYDQVGENTTIDATIRINGTVLWVYWIKDRENMPACRNFAGNCSITGTVQNVVVKQLYYDEILAQNVFVQIGEAKNCGAGTFVMNDGVLADTVKINTVEPSFGEYFERFQCQVRGGSNYWVKQYWSKDTGNFALEVDCSFEDVPEYAEVMIWNTAEPVVFNQDLAYIGVRRGDVTINGDLVGGCDTFDPSGDLQVHPYLEGKCKVVLNGDAENIYIDDVYNTEYNVTITGKCLNGNYFKGNTWGYFSCENVELVKNGVWNKAVLINSTWGNDGISYSAVSEEDLVDAVGDPTIGEEVVDGTVTLVKSVTTNIEQTSVNDVAEISQNESFKNILFEIVNTANETSESNMIAQPVCAIDISIESFYKNKDNGMEYEDNPNYGKESITELQAGKSLEFTVKVPDVYYDEDATYVVVRQHENADGSVVMEQLETTQKGDTLTFSSDKFSTFLIVEVVEQKDTFIEIKDEEGNVVKTVGIDESTGKYLASGLVAGTYELSVTRKNFVSRTYIIDVRYASEIVEVDIKLHKIGDITGDGVINARDKKMLFNHIAGSSKLEGYNFDVADVNGDGVINARDKKMVFNHIAGTNSLWE